ncbi:MAG: hypothetical protein ACR2P2_15295 [Nakamurella sp.]
MPLAAVYDACVLYPSVTRDLLMRTALAGTVRARWSPMILEELRRNLLESRPDITGDQHARMVDAMNRALPDALVTRFENLIEAFNLPGCYS